MSEKCVWKLSLEKMACDDLNNFKCNLCDGYDTKCEHYTTKPISVIINEYKENRKYE